MPGAPLPDNEATRLDTLASYDILDSLPEQAYDDIVLIASALSGTPIALVSLIDEQRQWFKARLGLDVSETARELAFCGHAILDPGEMLIVKDALEDERFASNPLVVSEPNIRFYAGAPLVTSEGTALGTLCVIDRVPRELGTHQIAMLRALARQVMTQLELRRALGQLRDAARVNEAHQRQHVVYQRQLEQANESLRAESDTDSLTTLMNRRAFDLRLDEEYDRAARYGTELSIIMIDVDDFKAVNDVYGHSAGDTGLVKVANILSAGTRGSDSLARYGGEEFAVVLPNTERANAFLLAERFRAAIEGADWDLRPLTISLGVATLSDFVQTRSALVDAADRALYEAKADGRNLVRQAPS